MAAEKAEDKAALRDGRPAAKTFKGTVDFYWRHATLKIAAAKRDELQDLCSEISNRKTEISNLQSETARAEIQNQTRKADLLKQARINFPKEAVEMDVTNAQVSDLNRKADALQAECARLDARGAVQNKKMRLLAGLAVQKGVLTFPPGFAALSDEVAARVIVDLLSPAPIVPQA